MSQRVLTAALILVVSCSFGCAKRGPSKEEVLAARINLNTAIGYLQKGDLPLALQHIRRAHAILPKDAEVLHVLGLVYYRMGNIDQALAAYAESIAADPKIPEVRNNYAIALSAAGRHQEAIDQCQIALKDAMYSTPAAALFNMAKAYQALGDISKAVESYQQSIQMEPGFDRPYYELARIKERRGSYAEAEELLLEALKRNRYAIEAHYELAMVRYTRGDRAGAEKALKKLLEIAPKDHPLREDAVRFMETVLGTEK